MCSNCDIAYEKTDLILKELHPLKFNDKMREEIFNHVRDAIYATHPEYNVHIG